jgi:hypothetical protein
MPSYTRGFIDHRDALEHFEDHKDLLGVITVEEYVERADRFLGAPLAELPGVEECQRPEPERDWVRYNVATMEFGVISDLGDVIYTYYIAEPHRLRGRTFRQYCLDQCARRWIRA